MKLNWNLFPGSQDKHSWEGRVIPKPGDGRGGGGGYWQYTGLGGGGASNIFWGLKIQGSRDLSRFFQVLFKVCLIEYNSVLQFLGQEILIPGFFAVKFQAYIFLRGMQYEAPLDPLLCILQVPPPPLGQKNPSMGGVCILSATTQSMAD